MNRKLAMFYKKLSLSCFHLFKSKPSLLGSYLRDILKL